MPSEVNQKDVVARSFAKRNGKKDRGGTDKEWALGKKKVCRINKRNRGHLQTKDAINTGMKTMAERGVKKKQKKKKKKRRKTAVKHPILRAQSPKQMHILYVFTAD